MSAMPPKAEVHFEHRVAFLKRLYSSILIARNLVERLFNKIGVAEHPTWNTSVSKIEVAAIKILL